ncbi:Electron transfer DM13 [Lutibacter agarilyticus]|uniref:Electron transfer DM13 n=1 Tax=Lutibacter agarilyticus TaxID=1109740 RepID=A0A238XUB1_9FLAO|nr:DM13 domain-containing protein [Lutibacter agarilyticus]SNR62023.1 Electron transfer DM13 [Lutibacter agarilyticus]
MKKIVTLLCLGILLVNCSNNDDEMDIENSTEIVVDETQEMGTDMYVGNFVSLAHPTSGVVSVSDDMSRLDFKNFKTDNGPKLLVYLTTDTDATEYVNLGDLKGIEGDYNYTIPDGTDIGKYKLVNIWCVDFSVSFGYAELKK